jgi:hypothetical protein
MIQNLLAGGFKFGISRSVAMLLGVPVFSAFVLGCGSADRERGVVFPTSKRATTTGNFGSSGAISTSSGGYLRGDEDGDGDSFDDYDDHLVLDYGHAAHDLDRRAASALVEAYFKAAVAARGATACALLSSTINKGDNLINAIPLEMRPGPESSITRHSGCPHALSVLFKQDHRTLANEFRSLRVSAVRVSGDAGFAVLRFTTKHERKLAIVRKGRAWKIGAVLDTELP